MTLMTARRRAVNHITGVPDGENSMHFITARNSHSRLRTVRLSLGVVVLVILVAVVTRSIAAKLNPFNSHADEITAHHLMLPYER